MINTNTRVSRSNSQHYRKNEIDKNVKIKELK